MRKTEIDMLSGSITRGLLGICIPLMIMNVAQSLFNIIDMTILKTYDPGDGIAVGAVGACSSIISLITGLVIGVSTGANVITARCIGEKDPQRIRHSVHTSMAFSLVSGCVMAVTGIFCAELFLRWSNCPETLLPQATLYFRLYFAGMPISMVYNFSAAVLRASGDSRRPMLFLLLGSSVKVALNYLFIAKFGMGIAGVALTTLVSWSISAGLCLLSLAKNRGSVTLELRGIRFYKTELKQILHIGVPAGLQQGLYSFANVVIMATVNSFGAEATTGISIANNFDSILYQMCTAPALAVMPYVSQNIGAGNISRAMRSVRKGILITVCLGTTFGSLSAIFSGQLSSIMSSNPQVIAYSQQKMMLISSTYFICGINEILGAALRGMGKPFAPTLATLLFMFLLRFVWVYLIFPLLPNLTFLYLVWPVGWVLSIITLLFVLLPTTRKLLKTVPPALPSA